MLEVAFSRRMCCSRVCSVSTKPRRPSTSMRLPRDAAGHPTQIGLARGEEPERGAAEVETIAERLALPHRHVHAALARRGEDAEHDWVDLGDRDQLLATVGLGGGAQRRGVLDGAVEVGLGEDRGARVLVDRLGPSLGVGDAIAESGPRPPRCRNRARRCAAWRACAGAGRRRRRSASDRCGALPDSRRRRPRSVPRTPRRWRRAVPSARRSRFGTRTSPAARPGRSRAGRACRE